MNYTTGLAKTTVALGTAAMVAACGGGGSNLGADTSNDTSGARGSLIYNPPLTLTSLSATEFTGRLNETATGQGLLAVAGTPKCGVRYDYIQYGTVGGAGEATTSTGALVVPTGTDPACSGPRPVVVYAHGTATDKDFNLANITDSSKPGASEGALIGAMFAAQGFIVVAPNYAGYGESKLGYHPFLNADQQSKEMIDALTAARKAYASLGVSESGKLFVTGYSQGGHVAMATQRALQQAGTTVTASAPMSGPYAMSAFGDAIFYGNVNLGSTVFVPMIATSYQKAYGNIYASTSDFYEATYAPTIESLLPSTTPVSTLFQQGKLPQTALFSSTPPAPAFAAITPPTTPAAQAPLFALGFGTNNLVKNSVRLAVLADAQANPDGAVPSATTGAQPTNPQHPVRVALKKNDMRNWTPTRPTLLCGGNGDPTVFFSVNTQLMQRFWSAPSPAAVTPAAFLTVLDVDSAASGATDPYALAKGGFARFKTSTAQAAVAAGATDGGAAAVTQAYHAGVAPFCTAAARGFFQQVLAANL